MEKIEVEILDLFNRYLIWVYDNNLKDNIDNYLFYINNIKNILKWYGLFCYNIIM